MPCIPKTDETSMNQSLHVVCPHCDTVNRVPRAKLAAGGRCGACHQPFSRAGPLLLTEPVSRAISSKATSPAGRFLGIVVRALRRHGSSLRTRGAPARTQHPSRQSQYRPGARACRAVRCAQHPDDRARSTRSGDRSDRRRPIGDRSGQLGVTSTGHHGECLILHRAAFADGQ